MKLIRGFYSGCVKSGNLGDDILFIIFVKLLSRVIKEKYLIECESYKKPIKWTKNNKWLSTCNIGVVGGGSVIHPEEISYTNGIKNYRKNIKTSLIFGTGISDSHKFRIPEKNRKDIISGKTELVDFPCNDLMIYNIKSVNDADFGGLRGPLDINIAKKILPEFSKNYIYDPGIIFYKIVEEKNKKSDKKIIGINLAEITGESRISKRGEKYENFTDRIKEEIEKFCRFGIKKGYEIHFYSFCKGDSDIHIDIIRKLSKDFPNKKFGFDCLVEYSTEKICEILSSFSMGVSLRLHSNILLNSLGVPTICLAYNIKSINYMKSIECEDLFIATNSDLTFSNIKSKFSYLEKNYDLFINKIEHHRKNAYEIYYKEISKMLDKLDFKDVENAEVFYDVFNHNYGIYEIKINKNKK